MGILHYLNVDSPNSVANMGILVLLKDHEKFQYTKKFLQIVHIVVLAGDNWQFQINKESRSTSLEEILFMEMASGEKHFDVQVYKQ